jgi:hypothetical protein
MLGRRKSQRSLFESQAWPHRVPADSFHARLGLVSSTKRWLRIIESATRVPPGGLKKALSSCKRLFL